MGGPVDVLGLVGRTVEQVRFDACVDAGGFGLIYRGYHQGLGEVVAIKCLRIATVQKTNEDLREALAARFRDETKLLYRLSQGNLDIVRCIGSGTLIAPTTNEITPYMVLEWLDGCTLSAELKERRDHMLAPRTLAQTVELMDSAVLALAYAHENDVVHRDVKPGNLFLTRTRDGVRMKVLDFGLAKILSDEAIGIRPSVETGMGVHFCSPSYGAPEQFSRTLGNIGPWTDVYSLALVILEVLTNTKVRPATSLADGLMKAADPKTGSPTASSLGLSLPKAAEDLLHRAVAKDPRDRPRDAGVFWTALKQAAKASVPDAGQNLAAAAQAAGRLGATVADDGMLAAMQQVREAAARAAMSPSPKPSPFAGTMLMPDAPRGAPHLPPHLPPPPAPATSPILAPSHPAPAPHPSSLPPPAIVVTGPPAPMHLPQSRPPGAAAQSPPAVRPTNMTPSSPAPRPPMNGSGGVIVAAIVAVAILIAGGALYWLRARGH